MLNTRALSTRIGVEVEGLEDPGNPEGNDAEELRRLLARHHLLLVRSPDLGADGQRRFVETFGSIVEEREGGGEMYISNARSDAPPLDPRGLGYHSDLMWNDPPLSLICLYAVELPAKPAPTLFANGAEAARHLPEDLRQRFTGAEALFLSELSGGYSRYTEETASPDARRTFQQVLFDDPVSGQPVLVIDQIFMDKIAGWDPEESERARDLAHTVLYEPENTYAHPWSVGDLLIWNNVALQHGRPKVVDPGARTLRRVVASCFDVDGSHFPSFDSLSRADSGGAP